MANGYCASILQHISAVLNSGDPAKKISPPGFLQGILANQDDSVTAVVNEQFNGGHKKTATVSYSERVLASQVKDTIDCNVSSTPVKKEFSYPSLITKSIDFIIPNDLIRQYCIDASQYIELNAQKASVLKGGLETRIMREVYEQLINHANALLTGINIALVNSQLTKFGKNTTTNSTAAKPLTFALDSNTMSDVFIQMLADMRENEFCNDAFMVGNGPFANLDFIRKAWGNGPADNGLNKAVMMNMFPETFYDKSTRDIWGENEIGVFEKGSVALLSYDKYVGNFARRMANSDYFNVLLPVSEFNCPLQNLENLSLDIQIREIDCATTMNIDGVDQEVSEGVQVILSKQFQLFTRPATLYNAADPMFGTNGTLRYQVTSA